MTVVARVGPGGEVTGLVTLGREIETPSAASAQHPALAYDELTGLPGRAILDDRIHVALAHAARDGRRVAVILADVDAMKDINDSFGHAVGDDVLRRLARTMSRGVRSRRHGRAVGRRRVRRARRRARRDRYRMAGRRASPRRGVPRARSNRARRHSSSRPASGSRSATPDDAPAQLLQRADAAMYRAKAMGGAKVVAFEDGAEVSITTLADELAVAVSHGLIRPHVQPIVDLRHGRARRIPRARALGTSPARAARRGAVRPRRGEHADPAGHRPRRAPTDRRRRGTHDARTGLRVRARTGTCPAG